MATATLSYNLADLIGEDFDPRRTKVWITANVPLIVVDGTTVRLDNHPTQSPASDGTGSFTLVTTNSAVNPTSFAYTFHVDYALKGREGKREQWHSSEFTFTTSANIAAISEAFDGLAIAPTWQSEFRDEMEALKAATSAIAGADTADELITVLDADPGSEFRQQQDARQLAVAKAAARTPFPSGLTGASFYDLSTGFYGARGKLTTSRNMLDQARVTGYGIKRAACIGHSNVAGAGPVEAGVTTWPDLLRETLRQQGVTRAGTGVVLAQNGTGTPDARYTFSAGWTPFATGSPAMKATAAGETATFATGIAGTQVDVYTFDTTKQMSVTIDGVAKTAIVGTPSDAVRKFSFTGLANTTHTVVLTTTDAGQDHYVVGIECHSGEGLSLSNLGIAGSSMDQWADSQYYMASGILRLLDPTLVFIQCQVNDAKMGRSAADWKTYANTVIGYIKEAGEAVIVIDPTPNPVGTGPYPDIPSALWQQYRQAALDLGDETATPVIDLSEIFGPYALASAAGWMFDSVHQSVFGSEVISRAAADMLKVT